MKFEMKPFKLKLSAQQREDKGWRMVDTDADRDMTDSRLVERCIDSGLLDSCFDEERFEQFGFALKNSLPLCGLRLWGKLCLRDEELKPQFAGLGDRWRRKSIKAQLNIDTIKKWARDCNKDAFKKIKDQVATDAKNMAKDSSSGEDTFRTMATEFELTHAKLISKSCYVNISPTEISFFSERQLMTSYNHLFYTDKEGKQQSFIQKWLFANPRQKRFRTTGMYPPGGEQCPDDVLNMWTPFAMELVEVFTVKPDAVKLFLKHLEILCNHDAEMTSYLTRWIAQLVQYPGIKSRSPAFTSNEGAGKGELIETLCSNVRQTQGSTVR